MTWDGPDLRGLNRCSAVLGSLVPSGLRIRRVTLPRVRPLPPPAALRLDC